MKKIFICFLLKILFPTNAICQLFAPQIFAGNNATEFNVMWAKNLDSSSRFSLFNYSFFSTNYKDKSLNTSEIYQVGTYNLTKNLGLALGGRFRNNEFLPQFAISLQHTSNDLYINLFPAVQYSFLNKEFQYGLFGLLIHTKKLNNTWGLYNQLMFEPLFSKSNHILSYQQLRAGLDYKNQFQFGFGCNLEQVGSNFQFFSNFGFFIRKDL
jgi:hypothetical protein